MNDDRNKMTDRQRTALRKKSRGRHLGGGLYLNFCSHNKCRMPMAVVLKLRKCLDLVCLECQEIRNRPSRSVAVVSHDYKKPILDPSPWGETAVRALEDCR